MKKKLSLMILGLLVIFSLSLPSVQAAQGTWNSSWQWDANGVSSIGTANAQNESGYFSLRVIRAGNQFIGNKNVLLAPNQSASTSFWGQPLLDRQGQVLVSDRYYHTPWFDI